MSPALLIFYRLLEKIEIFDEEHVHKKENNVNGFLYVSVERIEKSCARRNRKTMLSWFIAYIHRSEYQENFIMVYQNKSLLRQ